MKCTRVILCSLLILAVLFTGAGPAFALQEEASADSSLRFRKDGTFTILVLSDAQDTQFVSPYLRNAVSNILYNYQVDLVILLGDQLDGENALMRVGYGYDNVRSAIRRLVEPMVTYGVPFAVLFGESDYQAPASVSSQADLYRAYPQCVAVAESAVSLPVYGADGAEALLNLFLFDTDRTQKNGDTGAATQQQVEWYLSQSEGMRQANQYQSIPSVAFMHTGVDEVSELFDAVPEGTANALAGNGEEADRWFLPGTDGVLTGEAGEAPQFTGVNNGLFSAFTRQKDVFLAVSGRQHLNSFIGSLHGIDLAAIPGSSYTGYGDAGVRGARLFRFSEHHVQDYETLHVRFSDYDHVSGFESIRYYLLTTTGIRNTVKIAILACVLLGAVLLLVVLIIRQDRRDQADSPVDEDQQMEEPEDPYL